MEDEKLIQKLRNLPQTPMPSDLARRVTLRALQQPQQKPWQAKIADYISTPKTWVAYPAGAAIAACLLLIVGINGNDPQQNDLGLTDAWVQELEFTALIIDEDQLAQEM